MILADKIIKLRKQHGWSQEELALKLNVSRQSVSKWESMASIPDLDKIIKLSELFGVSTDYLLRDEMEIDPNAPEAVDKYEPMEEKVRQVSLEEANTYMEIVEHGAKKLALGVAMCIFSPVMLIMLAGMAEYHIINITEDMAGGLGTCILLLIIAPAVALFIMYGMRVEKYEYLEKEWISLDYGVSGIVEKKKSEFEPFYRRRIAVGVSLCVIAVVPILLAAGLGISEIYCVYAVCLLLIIIAVAVCMITYSCTIWESYAMLLEEGEYTRDSKLENKKNSVVATIYWLSATAIYLAVSFITMRWDRTWIIWPVAGVGYGVLVAALKIVRNSRKGKEN